jgi:glycine betaine/proline transport system substrate-binding protein
MSWPGDGIGARIVAAARRAATTFAAALLALPLLAGGAPAETAEEPIRFALNEWTGQRISTHLMAAILAKAGHPVTFVEASYMDQLDEIAAGRIDVAMEYWSTSGMPVLQEALSDGSVQILGATGMHAREEWWYPVYMKERCPGLPDWRALKQCAATFAVPETAPKGRYLAGPVTWGGFDEERVAALGLDFEVVHADTEADLYATLEAAVAKHQPVLLWVYTPHWAPVRHQGEWVQFPAFTDACYREQRFDCGKPSGPIWKVGAKDLPERWPEAVQAIRAFHLSNEEMGAMIARVDVDGLTIEETVAEWMAANEAVWKSWLD